MFTSFRMKILWISIFAIASAILFGQKVSASTIIDQDVEIDTTWTKSGSPYFIDRTIAVMDNATLTIESGVEIKFKTVNSKDDVKNIYIFGKVIASGTEAEPIYFTSNGDDTFSNTDNDEELCDYEEYDNEGNLIIHEGCQYYDFNDPYLYDWGGLYFINSLNSHLSYVNFKYAGDATLLLQNSNLTLNNIKISNSYAGIGAFEQSYINASDISFEFIKGYSISLYDNTLLNFKNLDIRNTRIAPIDIIFNSSFSGENLKFDGLPLENFDFLDRYSIGRGDSNIPLNGNLLRGMDGVNIILKDSTFINCPRTSCLNVFDTGEYTNTPSLIDISKTIFRNGENDGILIYGNSNINAKIYNSVFLNFPNYAIESYFEASYDEEGNPLDPGFDFGVDARNNFFGDATGPFHLEYNSEGLGSAVSDNVDFIPWLTSDPFLVCEVDCFSNIMFIPGMEGSRLYGLLDEEEKELWFSRRDSYHETLFLNEQGKSINNIYTKNDTKNNGEQKETGIIDEAIFGINVYDSLINELRGLKTDKVINDYSLIPYDWRLSLEDIIRNGKTFGDKNQNLSYLNPQAFDESLIYQELSKLAKSSKNGKVSIISHSNGGLVTKALLQKLKDAEDSLYNKIDKIFLVAVPQIGTPESVLALLYGTGLGPANLIMDKDISRALGENMPTLYNLLPRESYFNLSNNSISKDIINFDDAKLLAKEREMYGNSIDSFEELSNYLLGKEGREKPDLYDIKKANIANTYLYDQAKNIYEILDNWQPPENAKIIQVGGWGKETLLGIDYNLYEGGLNSSYLSHKFRNSIYGDGTVVLSSSLYIPENNNVERWYSNLAKIGNKYSHAYMLESPKLLSFIRSKIENEEFVDSENILVKDQSALVSNQKNLIYTLHSPLYLGVFDIEGNFTGRDKDGNLKNEIPGVEYSEVGEVQTLSVPIELAHTLTLYGYEDGVFALELDEFLNDTYSDNQLFQGIETETNTVAKLVFEGENSLEDLKLLLDKEGDGEFEEEYIPEKEEPVEPVKKVEDPGGVVLTNFINQVAPLIPSVLGVSTAQALEIEEEKISENEIIQEEPVEEKNKVNINIEQENIKVEDKAIITEKKEEIIKPTKEVESGKKPLLIFSIIILLLISLKFLFKVL